MKFIHVDDDSETYWELSNRQRRYFNAAFNLAILSTERQKHGAVIVGQGRVLGIGVNTFRNNPRTTSHTDMLSTHAEHNAVSQLRRRHNSLTAFVVRVNREGKIMYSEPCRSCKIWLDSVGVTKVIHS